MIFDFGQIAQNAHMLFALVAMWTIGVVLKNRVERFDHNRWMWAVQVLGGLLASFAMNPGEFDLSSVYRALELTVLAMGGHAIAKGVSNAAAGERGSARRGAMLGLLMLGIAGGAGCAMLGAAGHQARELVTVPSIVQAWPGVEADVLRGVNDAVEDGDLTLQAGNAEVARTQEWDEAMALRDRDFIVVLRAADWARFEALAGRGIQDRLEDGEVGPGVAASLAERVEQFDRALAALAGEPSDPDEE